VLIAPVAGDLEPTTHTCSQVSLDDLLRYVPLALLYDGKHYRVERHALGLFTAIAGMDFKDRPQAQGTRIKIWLNSRSLRNGVKGWR